MSSTHAIMHCTYGHLARCSAALFCDCSCHAFPNGHPGRHRGPGLVDRFLAWLAR